MTPYTRGRADLLARPHCLYRAYSGNALLYVGVTVNLAGRLSKHGQKSWWPEVTEVVTERGLSRRDAFIAESKAIATENPLYNLARPAGAN